MKSIKSTLTTIAPLALSAPLTQAQGIQDSALVKEIDEVTIISEQVTELSNQASGLRTGTPLIDVAQSLTVFSKEELKEKGIDDIRGIVDYTPGVNSSLGEGHRDAVVFRGVRSTADFFIDGVRDDVQYFRDLYNIEQVEILRGPSALFFGRGGTGGVLNRVQKKAELDGEFTQVETHFDTFGAFGTRFDYNKPISDKAAFRLNFHYDELENHRDLFDGERLGFNPTFTYEISPSTTVRASYEYADHERFIDRGIPSDSNGDPVDELDGTTFGDSELNFNDVEAHIFRLSIDHEINSNWKASATTSYGKFDKVYSNYFASDFNDVTNEVEIDGYIDTTERENFVLSGDIIGNFDTAGVKHKLAIGAEYIHTASDQFRFNNVFASNGDDQQFFAANNFSISNGVVLGANGDVLDVGTFSDLNDNTEVTIDVYSFFLQDEISLFNEKLDIILGARFDSFDIRVNNLDPNAAPGDAGVQSNRDSEVSPRFGFVYKPVEAVSFYGTYSESFLPRSGEQFADINGDDAVLDADTFTNLEIGFKWDIKPGLNFTLSAFEIEQESTQVGVEAGTLDIVESEVRGIEAQIKGNITDRLYISAGYSFLEGDDASTGLRLRELPQNTFSVWGQYQATDKLGLGLGLVYQDETFTSNDEIGDVRAVLPSYVRVDASANYQINENLRVQLNIENLFDTEYFPASHTADNIGVGAPINARIALTARF